MAWNPEMRKLGPVMCTLVTSLMDYISFGIGHVGNPNCAFAADLEKLWSSGASSILPI